jgi:hypothetical protein
MTGDEDHTVADQFAGKSHRLIGVAVVVAHDQLDALPQDAAVRVEIRRRQLGATLILLAEPRVGAGHRAGHSDPDLGLRRPRAQRRNRYNTDEKQFPQNH